MCVKVWSRCFSQFSALSSREPCRSLFYNQLTMKDLYQNILDLAFELEGLARLRLDREGGDSALDRHIFDKIKEFDALMPQAAPQSEEKTSENIAPEEAVVTTVDEEDDLLYSIEDDEPEPTLAVETPEAPEDAADTTEACEVSEAEKMQEAPIGGAMPPISVNDRFRFRRELFGGSNPEFESALNLIATMDNYEEAYDYFIVGQEWDEQQPVVSEFLDMLRRYFSKK